LRTLCVSPTRRLDLGSSYIAGVRFLQYSHAREFFTWFLTETVRNPQGGMEARLCDRYYLLTEILGRADMLRHGDPGEAVPAGNASLYERCREVEGQPDDRLDLRAHDHYKSTMAWAGLRTAEVTQIWTLSWRMIGLLPTALGTACR
jgi:hypothetical protein